MAPFGEGGKMPYPERMNGVSSLEAAFAQDEAVAGTGGERHHQERKR